MDQQEWKKVNEIVDTALNLEGDERKTFINKKCADNESLKYQVTELLKSIKEADTEDFLEGSMTLAYMAQDVIKEKESTYHSSLIGKTIDKYKILELVGHGGMGSVFLAERADDAYDQKVALKILRRGMDTPSNIERFKRERNILARLNHPNIARLLDGGVTADGLPYLVMEYVDGTPLLEYCDNHQLSIGERLALFKSVCKAVQHAHRNTIIHRDLKPSNIYVSNDGTVKVLDFGIAKLMEPDNPEKTLFETQTGARILTLGYAAPEQIENSAITTATDSYTLGILLYKLLAGAHPFDMDDKNISGIEKTICIQRPDRPSKKFNSLDETEQTETAPQRSTTPADLAQTLRGDLDAIVMKALRKEPEARYRSVEQMLEDLNRYDQSLPLIAQSDTFRYRMGKFLRRNRNLVAGILLTLIAILGLGSYHIKQVTQERNIAKTEAQKAQTIKNFLMDIFRSSNPQSASFKGKDLTAKELLINGKDKISKELKTQPDVYTEIMLAIGDALTNIDAFEEAAKSYKKAIIISSQTSSPLENKIRAMVKLGFTQTKRTFIEKGYNTALEAQKLLKKIQTPPPALEALMLRLLGNLNVIRDNYELANSYYKKADSIYVSAGMENSDEYLKMSTGYGGSLIWSFNFKKAEQILLQANKLHRKKYDNPTLIVAENYLHIAWAYRELGNFEKSNKYFLKSIELKSKLTGKQSVRTAMSMYHLSRNYTLAGDFEKAEQLAKKVLKIYQKHLKPPSDYLTRTKNYIAIAKYHQGELAKAKQSFQEIINKRIRLHGKNHITVANVRANLALVHQKIGNHQKAISLLKKTIKDTKRVQGEQSRFVAVDMLKLANVYRDMGNYEMAKKYFRKVRSIFEEELPENHYCEADFYFKYAKLEQDMGNTGKARKYFKNAYDIYADIFGEDSNKTKKAKSYLEQIAEA